MGSFCNSFPFLSGKLVFFLLSTSKALKYANQIYIYLYCLLRAWHINIPIQIVCHTRVPLIYNYKLHFVTELIRLQNYSNFINKKTDAKICTMYGELQIQQFFFSKPKWTTWNDKTTDKQDYMNQIKIK